MKTNKMRFLLVTASILSISVGLSGCSTGNAETSTMSNPLNGRPALSRAAIEKTVVDDGYRVDASLQRFEGRDAIRAGGAQVSGGIFVGARAEKRSTSASLPMQFEGPNAVVLSSTKPMSLPDIAARLSEVTGLHHIVSLGPTGNAQIGNTAQSSITAMTAPMDDGTLDPAAMPQQSASNYIGSDGASVSPVSGKTIIPQLRGPLSRILDEISTSFDVEWEYKEGKIVFRDFVTRQYQISALPSKSDGQTTIGGSGTGAGSSMSVSTSSTIDVWEDVRNAIQGLIGQGGNISLSPSTGMVTVTSKPADQERVANYIKDLNGSVGQQITFDVHVLTVNLTGERNHGISLDAVFDTNSTARNGVNVKSSEGAVNIGIVSGDFQIGAVVKALEKYGNVSVATRAGTTTSNNKLTPVNVTDITPYISGMEYSNTGTGNNTNTVGTPQVEEIETGFQIQLLPRVLNNREIMVQYALRLSELTGMESVTYPGGVQQLPRVSETAMEQQAVLRNGQTLVLSGFERDRTEISDSAYDMRMPGVGGARTQEKSRVATVMLITPRLLDRQDLARR